VLLAAFGSNRRRAFPTDFGHHEVKSAVTMPRFGLLVEWRVERHSNPGGRVMKAYICDSCGRISSIRWADGSCSYCLKSTRLSPQDAVEVPIAKCEFGTDFIAVVYQGKAVDMLLASDRRSVQSYLCPELVKLIQEYVDHLEHADETRETNDIEVKYENNVYVVRQEEGAPRIFIPAISNEAELGDSYLSASEREAILTLAMGMKVWVQGKGNAPEYTEYDISALKSFGISSAPGAQPGGGCALPTSFAAPSEPHPQQPKRIDPKMRGKSPEKESGPFIDDQWRDVLAGQSFSPENMRVELWRSAYSHTEIQITHDEEGDPIWRCYINGTFVEEGNESGHLLSLLETSEPEKPVVHGREPNDEDKKWMKSIGIEIGGVENLSSDRSEKGGLPPRNEAVTTLDP